MLKPDEVLDMSLDVFQAYVEGFSEHMFDLEIIGIQTGFWSAYFKSKRPKSLSNIIETVTRSRNAAKKKPDRKSPEKVPEVDVDAFLAKEAAFKKRYEKIRGGI